MFDRSGASHFRRIGEVGRLASGAAIFRSSGKPARTESRGHVTRHREPPETPPATFTTGPFFLRGLFSSAVDLGENTAETGSRPLRCGRRAVLPRTGPAGGVAERS